MIKAILSYKQLDPFMLTPFDAESELFVREREYREERQFCEPEGGKRASPGLADRSGNTRERRWRPFDQPQDKLVSTFPNFIKSIN